MCREACRQGVKTQRHLGFRETLWFGETLPVGSGKMGPLPKLRLVACAQTDPRLLQESRAT